MKLFLFFPSPSSLFNFCSAEGMEYNILNCFFHVHVHGMVWRRDQEELQQLSYLYNLKVLLTLGCNNNSKARKNDDELNDLLTEDCLKRRQVERLIHSKKSNISFQFFMPLLAETLF